MAITSRREQDLEPRVAALAQEMDHLRKTQAELARAVQELTEWMQERTTEPAQEPSPHPLARFAGSFASDPFQGVAAEAIAQYRRELDEQENG